MFVTVFPGIPRTIALVGNKPERVVNGSGLDRVQVELLDDYGNRTKFVEGSGTKFVGNPTQLDLFVI